MNTYQNGTPFQNIPQGRGAWSDESAGASCLLYLTVKSCHECTGGFAPAAPEHHCKLETAAGVDEHEFGGHRNHREVLAGASRELTLWKIVRIAGCHLRKYCVVTRVSGRMDEILVLLP